MDRSQPIIGITAHRQHAQWGFWDRSADLIASEYIDAVLRAGAQVLMIPAHQGTTSAVVERLDGVILSGGPDIQSSLYGEAPHPNAEAPVPDRDSAEMAVLQGALDYDVPVLAVCRGLQLLNAFLGGSLIQHLPDEPRATRHGAGGVFDETTVSLAEGSWLRAALGPTLTGHCHHHQALRDVAPGLRVVGTAPDGVVEAVELESANVPVIGVQWHPEEVDEDELMAAFVRTVLEARSQTD